MPTEQQIRFWGTLLYLLILSASNFAHAHGFNASFVKREGEIALGAVVLWVLLSFRGKPVRKNRERKRKGRK